MYCTPPHRHMFTAPSEVPEYGCGIPFRKGTPCSPSIKGQSRWEWTPKAGKITFSPEWRHILLIPEEQDLETDIEDWWARVHDEDIAALKEASYSLAEGRVDQAEAVFRMRRMDGTWAWILVRGVVVLREEGAVVLTAGTLADVSRLRLNPKFQISEEMGGASCHQVMLENSPDLMVRMDRQLFPLYANPAVSRYLPRKPEELGDNNLEELGIETEHMAFLQGSVEKVFTTGSIVRAVSTFMTALLGEVTGAFSFWPEFNEEGKVVSVMMHMRDISEQTRTEQRARLNEMRLSALYQLTQMDNAPEEEVMRFVVENVTKLTGSQLGYIFIPKRHQRGQNTVVWSEGHYAIVDKSELPQDAIPPDLFQRPIRTYVAPLLQNGDGKNPTHTVFNGKLQIMRYIYAPVMSGTRLMCMATVCNKKTAYDEADLQQLELFINGAWLILRRHEYIRALHKAKETAERANKVKDEFLANVSHELRTPLNGMLSMLQLLEFSPLSGEQLEYARIAGLSGKALLRIISDILDFSRMESGFMELQLAPFDLKETLQSTLNLFAREAERKNLELEVSIDSALPVELIGDDARVRQIVFNLVGNAMKFTERGKVSVDCCLLPHRRKNKAWVYLAVADTGIGIPSAMQHLVFEAFTQIDNSSTRKYPGTGLGLGIVKRLLDQMGGTITLESQKGCGTTIHCSLPFTLARRSVKRKKEKYESECKPSMPLDILVAEDDTVSRFALSAFLKRAGHRPVCVGNGRQALEALQLYPFHCLFTDIQMPVMDGIEVVRRIRECRIAGITPSDEVRSLVESSIPGIGKTDQGIPQDCIVTAVSAHAMSGDKERFLREGMDLYLSKPVNVRELARVLEQISARVAPQAG